MYGGVIANDDDDDDEGDDGNDDNIKCITNVILRTLAGFSIVMTYIFERIELNNEHGCESLINVCSTVIL